jgi:hypothetical protein
MLLSTKTNVIITLSVFVYKNLETILQNVMVTKEVCANILCSIPIFFY